MSRVLTSRVPRQQAQQKAPLHRPLAHASCAMFFVISRFVAATVGPVTITQLGAKSNPESRIPRRGGRAEESITRKMPAALPPRALCTGVIQK